MLTRRMCEVLFPVKCGSFSSEKERQENEVRGRRVKMLSAVCNEGREWGLKLIDVAAPKLVLGCIYTLYR